MHCLSLLVLLIGLIYQRFDIVIDDNNVGEMLELSEAIRDYHDGSEFPFMVGFN